LKIAIAALTTCGVSADGETVELSFVDAAGTPMSLQLPFDCAQSFAMTLPSLLTQALQNITGEAQARYVFPLGSWRVEETGARSGLIATLGTEDGFEVSFGIPHDTCRSLGWTLQQEAAIPADADDAEHAPESESGDRVRLN
jgi:hypothetical protein